MKLRKPVGIIGFGNMGASFSGRLKGVYPVVVFDKDRKKTKALRPENKAKSLKSLLLKSDTIILAVKPQDFFSLLKKIKFLSKDKLIISIAAGISTKYIEKHLGKVRVIRVMPNLPAKIGKGISCLCQGRFSTPRDLCCAENIFRNFGRTLVLKEKMLDAATAVSGSGPGYFYYFLEAKKIAGRKIPAGLIKSFKKTFKKAAQAVGFSKLQAAILVEVTVEGSAAVLRSSKLGASQLKEQVASKGGTTCAALKVLARGGSLKQAVKAALKRAKELSKNE